MAGESRVTNTIRSRREQFDLSQGRLAGRVGASRQTLNAVEAGRTVPSTALALRLAAALSCRVEDLFRLPGGTAEEVTAGVAGARKDLPEGTRVRLATAGSRSVAVPLIGPLGALAALPEADGVVCGRRGDAVRVRLATSKGAGAETVVVAGCDPTMPVVDAYLRRMHPRYGLRWLPGTSLQALRWLREGAAHVAGVHLRDARAGEENIPAVRRVLGSMAAVVVAFATWEQGLIVAPGNPRGIHQTADLGRRGVTILNRERGSGARVLLDTELAKHGLSPARVRGYTREAPTHLAVAQAVALGFVDAGIGIRAAARAFGLNFVPLQRERYDLVIPHALLTHPPVQAFLDTIRHSAVRSELEAVGDYDTRGLGTVTEVSG